MTGNPSSQTVIPEILEQHLEEFDFLWSQRRQFLQSPEFALPDLVQLESRIEAHLDALLIAGLDARDLLEAGLSEDDADRVFAAAFVMLRLREPSLTSRVLDLFKTAEGDLLDRLREVLCHSSIDALAPALQTVLESEPAANALNAAAAAFVLAKNGKLRHDNQRLHELLKVEDPAVRTVAWQAYAFLEAS